MAAEMKNLSLRKLSEGADARFPKGTVSRKAMFSVEYSAIKPSKTFNPRNLKRPKIKAHIDSIFQSIMASDNVLEDIEPLELCVNEKGEIDINDGYCRYTAFGMAIKAGKDIGKISAFEGSADPSKRLMSALSHGKGERLEPLETARGYVRLIDNPEMVDDSGEHWTIESVARKQGVTTESVKQLLILGRASAQVQKYVEEEKINAHSAIDLLRKHGDAAGDVIAAEVLKAEAKGKSKVTKGAIEGRAIPKKFVSSMVSTIDHFTHSLSKETKVQLASLENLPAEQLTGKTVQVDAKAIIELMRVKHELDESKKRAADKERKKLAKASQAKMDV